MIDDRLVVKMVCKTLGTSTRNKLKGNVILITKKRFGERQSRAHLTRFTRGRGRTTLL